VRYVLDTNAVSAVIKSHSHILARLKSANRRDVLLPQPVLAEIAYGIARLSRSKRRQLLEERFSAVATTFERVAWTDAVSSAFGEIKALLERKGRPIEDFDVAIAAHALANSATLVTGNVKHMAGVPHLLVEDWLAPAR
jgi:tRNA(fMet)-specific endonuclease VapC